MAKLDISKLQMVGVRHDAASARRIWDRALALGARMRARAIKGRRITIPAREPKLGVGPAVGGPGPAVAVLGGVALVGLGLYYAFRRVR